MTNPLGKSQAKGSDLPRLHTAREVAAALGCSEWWVKEQARRRRIPFIKSGGSYRFTRDHFEEALLLLEERPTSEAAPAPAPAVRRQAAAHGNASVVQLRARRPRRARKTAA